MGLEVGGNDRFQMLVVNVTVCSCAAIYIYFSGQKMFMFYFGLPDEGCCVAHNFGLTGYKSYFTNYFWLNRQHFGVKRAKFHYCPVMPHHQFVRNISTVKELSWKVLQ